MESSRPTRQVVVPGDLIDAQGLKPGEGTFSEGGQIYAAKLGIRSDRGGFVSVIPIAGRYIPQTGDEVVGQIVDIGPSHWLVDINSPYPSPLHTTETPWRVEFGDTARYLNVGNSVIAKVLQVDETKRVHLTMRDEGLQRVTSGQVIEVSHSKVPRIIGRDGSMIMMIKEFTRCQGFVGQNGRVWIDGEMIDIVNAIGAIRMIEEHAQSLGLTDAVRSFFEGVYGKKE